MKDALDRTFVIKGNIVCPETISTTRIVENGFAVCVDGKSEGVFAHLPETFRHLSVLDYSGSFVFPGFTDLHVHAPQYAFRGIGMDSQLLEWLESSAFPEEAKYSELSYANAAYDIFAHDLARSVTTRACVFATIHTDATVALMRKLEKSGIRAFVGKVSMNRNCPDFLSEGNADTVEASLRDWLEKVDGLKIVKPILTPRFIPSCTDDVMRMVSRLRKEFDLPVQSHLSENRAEIDWVHELCPQSSGYADAYARFGLFGGECRTLMAHCVYPTETEIDQYTKAGVFVALCPESNVNIASGIAPVRKFVEAGVRLGLGSDIAGGSSLSMLKAVTQTVQLSKMYWRIIDESSRPVTWDEALYFATKGGGEFFGKVGSFEKNYEFDAVVINDARFESARGFSLRERLERTLYLSDDRDILAKYASGDAIFEERRFS